MTEKLHISHAAILLKLERSEVFDDMKKCGHQCPACQYTMTESASDTFDRLPELEDTIPEETKKAIVYVAGYITRKDIEDDLDTYLYYERYGNYTCNLSRGGLKTPQDKAYHWAMFGAALFSLLKSNVCRTSFVKLLLKVSEAYEFDMQKFHCTTYSNILFNNFCKLTNPKSSKESDLKIIKLSDIPMVDRDQEGAGHED